MNSNDEKIWLSTSRRKRKITYIYIIYFIIIIGTSINNLMLKNFSLIFYYNIIIGVFLIADEIDNKIKVICTEEKIIIQSPLKNKEVYWKEVNSYNFGKSAITFYLDSKIVDINTKYLKNKEGLTELIEKKLFTESETECLECGDVIKGNMDKCTKCSWSWNN
ncbi:hypothetical protein [Serpentinicella alkaliphila]|uniref:Uncharacterized protein n=2 Tax=Serpentinicella alkaliphila TaxID=1734049 RepID=A0A4R2T7F2_9FIRM|nr:hypothetical protein [Serpentinicella alkaliphila]TCP99079.1 hypothetical protein EDD79_10367 [Serpentinicella alkaliphila]